MPAPEKSQVTIAELNAAVHLPAIGSPGVVAFLSACTQCRQCVPACPADLSRADMVLFNKMKVEDAVPNHLLPLQFGGAVTQSSWMLDGLADQLTGFRSSPGTPGDNLRRMLLTVTLRQLVPDESCVARGNFSSASTSFSAARWSRAGEFGPGPGAHSGDRPGSFFGEMAVVADQPEPFTVSALEMTVVLEMPKAAVHRLIQHAPRFRGTMDELYRRRALFTYARRPNVLGGTPGADGADLFARRSW